MTHPTPRRRSLRQRIGARWRGDYEEDGVFRPVRLPLLVDVGVSVAIVLAAFGAFAGFFAWLAATQ